MDNERPHVVTFLDDGAASVPDNANLRQVFLREDRPLYSTFGRLWNCGGKARCGTCLVRIYEGHENLSQPTPFEKKLIGSSAPRKDQRLACQAMVRGPVTVKACSTE